MTLQWTLRKYLLNKQWSGGYTIKGYLISGAEFSARTQSSLVPGPHGVSGWLSPLRAQTPPEPA